MEATPGIEPGYEVLQTSASPLRHVAVLTPLCEGGDLIARRFEAVKRDVAARRGAL